MVALTAVLLLMLDSESAGSILKELPTETVEEVTRALASLGDVPRSLGDEIVSEFYSVAMAEGWAREGGLPRLKCGSNCKGADGDGGDSSVLHFDICIVIDGNGTMRKSSENRGHQ